MSIQVEQKGNPIIAAEIEKLKLDSNTVSWQKGLTSETTKRIYPRNIAEYLLYRKISISQLINRVKRNPMSERQELQKFVDNQLELGRNAGYIAIYVAAIQSRLRYDELSFKNRIIIPGSHDRPTIANETVPTKDQIMSLLDHANLRAKCAIIFIGFLGLRFKAIAGLKIFDFPEINISDNKISFTKTPTLIKIRKELSKNKKPYMVFLIEIGCNIVKDWLEFRIRQGEKLDSDSYILPVETDKDSYKKGASISKIIDRTLEKLGSKTRPYSLKNFFATALLNSSIEQNYQSFFLGHNGPMQLTYSLRRQLSVEQIEEMRQIFKEKIEPQLLKSAAVTKAQIEQQEQLKKLQADIKNLRNYVKYIESERGVQVVWEDELDPAGKDELRRRAKMLEGKPAPPPDL